MYARNCKKLWSGIFPILEFQFFLNIGKSSPHHFSNFAALISCSSFLCDKNIFFKKKDVVTGLVFKIDAIGLSLLLCNKTVQP